MLVLGVLTLGLLLPAATRSAAAAPTELFFSEYIEGSSNNKALEIYNGTGAPVDLAAGNYRVELYANGASTPNNTLNMTGTVADGDVYVIANSSAVQAILDQADVTSTVTFFNGDDAIVLKKNGVVIDVIGQVGFDPGSEWGDNTLGTADQTLRRKPTIQAGDTNPNDAFDPAVEWDGYANDTFDGLGWHTLAGGDQPILPSCPATVNVYVGYAKTVTVSAYDADNEFGSVALLVTPSQAGITLTNPLTTSNYITATLEIADTVPQGSYSAELTFTNDANLTATCTVSINVQALPTVQPIGEVQGAVANGDNPQTHRSPFAPASGNGSGTTAVTVQGVVYERVQSRTSSGATNYGFFIQNTAATADSDPNTSDGIFVFAGSSGTVAGYTPQVGDEIIITSRVAEYFYLTQLSSVSNVVVIRSNVDVDAEVPGFDVNPPALLSDAYLYWERHEGMRGQIPANTEVVGGRDVFGSTYDAEVWVVRDDVQLTTCTSPYAERVYRDAHPCDNNPGQLFDDGNGFRILMASLGIKDTVNDSTALLAPARTYDTITNTLSGGVYYSFNKYMIQVTEQPQLVHGLDPALNNPPQPFDRGQEYSISTYNVENLYDFRDDPNDGCDFAGNAGCPGVTPPFDYVPTSEQAYLDHLDGIATQVITDLHAPDILTIEEAEDQDICSVDNGALVCGTQDNADGKPDTLQELALVIAAQGGPAYDAANDRDGADDRGIVSAFLYRTDRVELLPAVGDPVLGMSPTLSYDSSAIPLEFNADIQNPKSLNATLPDFVGGSTDGNNIYTRSPQVGLFRIWRDGLNQGDSVDLYVIANHFSSGPDGRVEQRTEQANYDAAIVNELQEEINPAVKVVVGGDLNVFPRPDDPFPAPGQSDQLGGLYDQGLNNLWDVLVAEAPSSAYSYEFQGQTQTLDHLFITESLSATLVTMRAAHVNADWPADYEGDGARGVSDHDPQVARFTFAVQGGTVDLSGSSKTVNTSAVNAGDVFTYTITISNSGTMSTTYMVTDVLDFNLNVVSAPGMTVNGQTLSASGTVAANSAVVYTVAVNTSTSFGGTINNSATVSANGATYTLNADPVIVTAQGGSSDLSGSSKLPSDLNVVAGDVFTYTIAISNSGTAATTFAFTDVLDSDLVIVSAPGMTINGQTVTASDTVNANSQITYKIEVRTDPSFAGSITNIAQVVADGVTYTLTSPAVTVIPLPSSDLSASSKTVSSLNVMGGEVFTYTLNVSNTGSMSTTFALTDVLDANLTVLDAPGMTVNGQTVTATGLIDADSQITYHITVQVAPTFAGIISNTATLVAEGITYTLTAPDVNVGTAPSYRVLLPLVLK